MRNLLRALASLAGLALTGCGPIAGAIVASQDSSSSRALVDTNTAPQVTVVTPAGARPTGGTAALGYTVRDEQSDPVDVSVTFTAFDLSTGATRTGTARAAATSEATTQVSTSPGGAAHVFTWDYQADLGDNGAARASLSLAARDARGSSLAAATGDFLVGNDAPELVDGGSGFVTIDGTTGNVVVAFDLRDTSGDTCEVTATYAGPGIAGPRSITALVQSSLQGLLPPAPGAASVAAPARFAFTWKTDALTELGASNQQGLTVTLTPRDALGAAGTARTSGAFSVTNNTPPVVSVAEPSAGVDDVGPLALVVTVRDEQEDPVDLSIEASTTPSFQAPNVWTLPVRTVDADGRVEARDPALGPLGPNLVFCPELATSAAVHPVLGHPFVGKQLQAIEPLGASTTVPVAPALVDPAGLVLEPGGATALVLDRGQGGGALVRVDLAGGAASLLATGLGGAGFATLEPGDASLLASDATGGRLLRVDRTSGLVTVLAAGLGAPQGVAALTSREAVVARSPGDLVHVDLATGTALTIVTGLADPRGVALDRTHAVLFVAERGADRIARVDLMTRQVFRELRAAATPPGCPVAPLSLALSPDRRFLYVGTDAGLASQAVALPFAHIGFGGSGAVATGLSGPAFVAPSADLRDVFVVETGADRVARVGLGRRVLGQATITAVTSTTLVLSPTLALAPGARVRVAGGRSTSLTGLRATRTGVTYRLIADLSGVPLPTGLTGALRFRVTAADARAERALRP